MWCLLLLFRDTHILQEQTYACGVLKRHNFRVHVSPGSAETLVGRGGIINDHSIAYCLSSISAKNYRNRLMCVESRVRNISVVFFETQCIFVHPVPVTGFTQPLLTNDFHHSVHATLYTTTFPVYPLRTTSTLY